MILLTALEAWFTNTPADFSQYPTQYSHLIWQQTQIGWRQLFNRRLSTEWSRLQDKYLHQQGLHNKKTTGLLWATTILSKIWEEWTSIWNIQNQVIHGHDQTSRLNIQRLEAETELRAIYDECKLLLPADQDFKMLIPTLPTPRIQSETGLIPTRACLPIASRRQRSAH
jgi:hypothetical protein